MANPNEIVALPKLLRLLSLEGKVVTADAMHCQRQVARQVMEQSGDYVLALKGNQGSLNDDVRFLLDDPTTPVAQATELSKGHGRIETRTGYVSNDVEWLKETHGWPGLKAVGKVVTRRDEQNGRTSVETRYYLMSQAFSPERFNDIVRSHCCPLRIDCIGLWTSVFNEDQARNRKGHCAENLSLCYGNWL